MSWQKQILFETIEEFYIYFTVSSALESCSQSHLAKLHNGNRNAPFTVFVCFLFLSILQQNNIYF